jgi:hypothetical protein
MTIPFLPHVSEKVRDATRIKLNKVTIADVLENVKVRVDRSLQNGHLG